MLSLSELSRHMKEKIQNELAKVNEWKMFGNDVLNNTLKPRSSPHLQLFLTDVLTPYTEFED